MARVLFVSHAFGKFFPTEPSYDKVVAALEAASHSVDTATFEAAEEAECDVIVAFTDDTDLAHIKRLARNKPVVTITQRDKTARRSVRNGALWSIPTKPNLDVSLTEGFCSVDRAIAAKVVVDEQPEVRQYLDRLQPAGVEKATFDTLMADGLKGAAPKPKLNRRQRRRREALGILPRQDMTIQPADDTSSS